VPKGDSMRNMIFIDSLKLLTSEYIIRKAITSFVVVSLTNNLI